VRLRVSQTHVILRMHASDTEALLVQDFGVHTLYAAHT
jgi:hypothetical protein